MALILAGLLLPGVCPAGQAEAPWLQFRTERESLGPIEVERAEFVFPPGTTVRDSACYATADGYLFEANDNVLYKTDREGRLIFRHELPHPNSRGAIHFGGDYVAYTDASKLRRLNGRGEEVASVAVPRVSYTILSLDGNRAFFFRTMDPDLLRLTGPKVVDVKTGKTLQEHQLRFHGAMGGGILIPTSDGLIAGQRGGGLVRFGADGQIAWRSPLRPCEGPIYAGRYVPVFDPAAEALVVLDQEGDIVFRLKRASYTYARLLPDGERLYVTTVRDDKWLRQLYRLSDGKLLWTAPNQPKPVLDLHMCCLSPDGDRLAIFTRRWDPPSGVIDNDTRRVFTVTILNLTSGEATVHEELPFREKSAYFRDPRWLAPDRIEFVPADYLYRIRLPKAR